MEWNWGFSEASSGFLCDMITSGCYLPPGGHRYCQSGRFLLLILLFPRAKEGSRWNSWLDFLEPSPRLPPPQVRGSLKLVFTWNAKRSSLFGDSPGMGAWQLGWCLCIAQKTPSIQRATSYSVCEVTDLGFFHPSGCFQISGSSRYSRFSSSFFSLQTSSPLSGFSNPQNHCIKTMEWFFFHNAQNRIDISWAAYFNHICTIKWLTVLSEGFSGKSLLCHPSPLSYPTWNQIWGSMTPCTIH